MTCRLPTSFARFVPYLLLLCVGSTCAEEQILICRDHQHGGLFGIDLEGDGRRYAPDRAVDILHLRLDVTPDFARRTVTGTTRLEFQPISRPCDELRLDAIDLTIDDVRSDRQIADFTNTGKQLIVRFAEPLSVGERVYVEIDHSAEPVRGLYFRTPEMGYAESDTQVWTQGESHEARFWYPCFDYPNERSSTEVICHVPSDMIVLSNGRKVSESTDDHGLKRVQWIQEQPHANYLLCLVAGKFVKLEKQHGNIPLGFYAQPSLAEHAANAFADTDQIMAFYESEIGIPFPWEKYDQATILDFIAGGMENTTLTTLTENTIFSCQSENLRSSRQLDAHELAHQWFGDYVTCKDWSHLWLNEGFATYYTHLYEGHKFGRDAMLFGLYKDAQNRVLRQSKDPRPIVYRGYKNAAEQFDYRAYPKGSWVLHMLRSQLGPELYRDCIRHYLQKHALQSVVSEDLRQAVEELSGRSFDRFFDQWVYHGGSPELDVHYEWQGQSGLAKVTVRQSQETNDDTLLFELPTQLRFRVGDKTINHDILIMEQEHDFYVPLPAQPSVVRFDSQYTLLAKVAFKKPDPMLFAQLQEMDDVIGRLLAVEALAERKTHDSVEHLRRVLNEDPFFGVRVTASESLRKIGTDEAYRALVDSREQSDARCRSQVTEDLCSFYRAETLDQIERLLEDEQVPEIQATAIRALGKFHDKRAQDLIKKSLKKRSFRNALADAAVNAIEAQRDPQFVAPLLKTLRRRGSEFTSHGLANALGTLAQISSESQDSQTHDRVLEMITAHLGDPRSRVRQGAINALGQLKAPASAAVLESVTRTERDERVVKAAERALDQLQKTTSLAPQEVVELRKQLSELRKQSDELKQEISSLKEQFEAAHNSTKAKSTTEATVPASETIHRSTDAAP